MTDSEKLNNIEKYIFDLERSMSDILADNSRFKVKFEKFDKMSIEIAGLRRDFNTLSHDFHEFRDRALTTEGFDRLIDSMLTRTQEISEIRITTRKHESDIRRVEGKVDDLIVQVAGNSNELGVLTLKVNTLSNDVDILKSDVSELKSDVSELKSEMREGFSLLMAEIKTLKK
jgi:chromosome segregation ATPase